MEKNGKNIREMAAAGRYYPRDKVSLERELSLLLEASPVVNLPRPARALIVPHDAWTLSGGVAARAFRQIIDFHFKRAVLLTTAHHRIFPFISIFEGDAYRTALGISEIDHQYARLIATLNTQIQIAHQGHESEEYAIETVLPFLQWIMGKIPIIPIVFGEEKEQFRNVLWKILSRVLPLDDTLFIAITNLSRQRSYSEARMLDQFVINDIEVFDENRLVEDVTEKRVEMCSLSAVYTVMKIGHLVGANQSKVILYRNTCDVTGCRNDVSGYLAAVIY